MSNKIDKDLKYFLAFTISSVISGFVYTALIITKFNYIIPLTVLVFISTFISYIIFGLIIEEKLPRKNYIIVSALSSLITIAVDIIFFHFI